MQRGAPIRDRDQRSTGARAGGKEEKRDGVHDVRAKRMHPSGSGERSVAQRSARTKRGVCARRREARPMRHIASARGSVADSDAIGRDEHARKTSGDVRRAGARGGGEARRDPQGDVENRPEHAIRPEGTIRRAGEFAKAARACTVDAAGRVRGCAGDVSVDGHMNGVIPSVQRAKARAGRTIHAMPGFEVEESGKCGTGGGIG